MNYRPSPLYRKQLPDDLKQQIDRTVRTSCERSGKPTIPVLFRADDIGIPSQSFHTLIQLFRHHDLPLCLATVPAWITTDRFARLETCTGNDRSRWCWHQHGRLHRNFEPEGKKQEFGPARDYRTIREHLDRGRKRLEHILGDRFEPFFTPPWNRCSREALNALEDLGYAGLSRSRGAKPETSPRLPDIQVNVDLHTKKLTSAREEFSSILGELEQGLTNGYAGIMIHHQRMNRRSFDLLDVIMQSLKASPEIRFVLFRDLVQY